MVEFRGTEPVCPALAVARGVAAAVRARKDDVPRIAACDWAGKPPFRAAIDSDRRRAGDRALGRSARHRSEASGAIDRLAASTRPIKIRMVRPRGSHFRVR